MKPKRTVLYVDDERTNRVVFQHAFSSSFDVRTAESAAEALQILEQEEICVLVTDQRMPQMSGNELLQQTKSSFPQVIRIIVTAYSDIGPILQAVNDGLVARYLIKPWDRQELSEILEWAVEAYGLGLHNSILQQRLLETERLTTLGALSAAVFHDIRQPLSYLQSNTERLGLLAESTEVVQMLIDGRREEIDPKSLANIQELLGELPEIVDDMRHGCRLGIELSDGVSRLVGRIADSREPADPMPVLRYALSVSNSSAATTRASIDYDGPDTLPIVRMAWGELAQVLINLLTNAIQAVADRPLAQKKIVVKAQELEEELQIEVTDRGVGISATLQQRLGTPFITTRPTGTGLGLYQCRRIVESAGGELTIVSEEGEGTTVRFTIKKA